MKILKESKENLPVAFLTSFVSDGWEKVGILKEEIEAIKKEFKGTKKVEDLIQALIDAYLVCIGQMEQHLAAKDYLDIDEKEEVKESLTEDFCIINHKTGKTVTDENGKVLTFNSRQNALYYAQENGIWAENSDIKHYEPELTNLLKKAIKNEGLDEEPVIADAPEKVEKINDGEKVELHTELPDYDVEIEQKGKKVEVEVEPKFEEDEWPEPDMSDNKDIEAAKAALRNGKLRMDEPVILNNKKEDEIRSKMPVPQFIKDEIEHCEEREQVNDDKNLDSLEKAIADMEPLNKHSVMDDFADTEEQGLPVAKIDNSEYFMDDFPEPDLSKPALTDKDLYNN